MPEFYKYLFLAFIIWNTVYLWGFLKIEKKKQNYLGIAGVLLLQISLITLYLLNYVKF